MAFTKILNQNKNKILSLLILITAISFFDTINKGLINGCDFQWHPAVLFWEGINHYERFMINGKSEFLCQGGEYAHLLNIIYYPFTLLKWESARSLWVLINISFCFVIPFFICKKFKITKYKSIILILIFITCYPTRMTLNYGQQSLLVLFFLILPYVFNSKFSYFFSGFSSIKYNTGYIIFLDLLAKQKYKYFLLALIPYVLGWIIYFSYTSSNPVTNFFEPLEWTLQKGDRRGDSDLYSLIQIYFLDQSSKYFKYLSLLLVFFFNFLLLIQINKIQDNFLKMSLILFCPLIFLPHANYDYVLLFPLACYSLLNIKYLINKFNFYFVIYIFFIGRLVKHMLNVDWFYQPLLLVIMICLVCTNIYVNICKKKLFNLK